MLKEYFSNKTCLRYHIHNKRNIQKYIKIVDRIFSDISKKNLNDILKSDLCYKPIKRIN